MFLAAYHEAVLNCISDLQKSHIGSPSAEEISPGLKTAFSKTAFSKTGPT